MTRHDASLPSAAGSEKRETLPVCVVIPAYNRTHELKRCLESVWAQRPWLPAEVVVVDDGSSDETAATAEALGATVLRHHKNRGLAAARNSGLAATSCDWVALLDSDDEWLPNHLAELWRLKDDEHVLVATAAVWCTPSSLPDRFQGTPKGRAEVLRSARPLMETSNFICVSATLVKREEALAAGGFRPMLCEDLDLWVRLLESGTAVVSPKVTVRYYVHSGQMSLDVAGMHEGHRAVIESHLSRTGGASSILTRWEGVAAWDVLRNELRDHRIRGAAHAAGRLFGSPRRIAGVARLLGLRWRLRRRAGRTDRCGRSTVTVIVNESDTRAALLEEMSDRKLRDLSDTPAGRVVVELVHQPAGLIVSDSGWWLAVARLLRQQGMRPDPTP